MSCPKCHSNNIAESTTNSYRCNQCDYAWVPFDAPRFQASVGKKSESPILVILIILIVLLAFAFGFVSSLAALLIGIFGLLAGILYYLVRVAGK